MTSKLFSLLIKLTLTLILCLTWLQTIIKFYFLYSNNSDEFVLTRVGNFFNPIILNPVILNLVLLSVILTLVIRAKKTNDFNNLFIIRYLTLGFRFSFKLVTLLFINLTHKFTLGITNNFLIQFNFLKKVAEGISSHFLL